MRDLYKLTQYLTKVMMNAGAYYKFKESYGAWHVKHRDYDVLIEPYTPELMGDDGIVHGMMASIQYELDREPTDAIFVEWTPSMDPVKDADFLAGEIAKVMTRADEIADEDGYDAEQRAREAKADYYHDLWKSNRYED